MSVAVPFRGGIVLPRMPWSGPPTSDAWEAGTLIRDTNGDLFECTDDGTPGTWRALVSNIPPPDLVASFPEFIDTFPNGVQAGQGWATAIVGGGAALSQIAPPAGKGGRNQVVGVLGVIIGTSTTGRAGAMLGAAGSLLRFESGATYTLWCRVLVTDLSSAADEFRFRIGFLDLQTASDPSDGAYFEYQRVTSPNWICRTAKANTRTTSITDTVVQNANWIDLKIEVDGSAQIATFYIDDVQVAQINTNIPTSAGRETSIGFVAHKTAGGNSRQVAIDRIYMKMS